MNNEAEYYSSHQKLSFIGEEGQEKLLQAKVLVIGAGGLGCPCLQALTGAGIGTIGIADYDTVDGSNLHRQFLFNFGDVGKLKTTIAANRLLEYNPFVKIEPQQVFVNESNILNLVRSYDIVADCTDNFFTRYLINDACVYLNKPLVYGAIHKTDGHVTVFNYNESGTLRCLFPKDEADTTQSCADIGAYNITTAIIGTMMANEVIKMILFHPGVIAGSLHQLDSLSGETLQIKYQRSIENINKSIQRFTNTNKVASISVKDLAEKIDDAASIYLLDVREPHEHAEFNIGGINIPLGTLLETQDFNLARSVEVIVYCEKGNRSREAVTHLAANGFDNAVSLEGGLELWQTLYCSNY
jgi:molybdopterin/thiamine biosynthesis adenylyltransferase/rhodanese-related sulfurtransferase